MSTELNLSVTVTHVGQNMGDHAQDVTTALTVNPDMTIRDLAKAELTRQTGGWIGEPEKQLPATDYFITIRATRTAGEPE